MEHRSDRKKMPLQSSAFQHRLSSYVLAAGATGVSLLATSQPSEAEVVYTPAHHGIGQDQTFAIDLNHDGVTDFRLENALRHNSGYRGAQLQVNGFATGGGCNWLVCEGFDPRRRNRPPQPVPRWGRTHGIRNLAVR